MMNRKNRDQSGHSHNKKQNNYYDQSIEKMQFLLTHADRVLSLSDDNNRDYIEEIISNISDYVSIKGKKITTSQLRNIFAKVKKIETYTKLQLLRPQLAYIMVRQGEKDAKDFVVFLDKIIQKVDKDNAEHIKGFQEFMEAIVAYHKFHHPKN